MTRDIPSNPQALAAKLESFQCRRCNACCRQPGYVYLGSGEAENAAAYLKLELYDFTARYCELLDRRQLVLKKHADEACVFLTAEGCRIHEVKPRQCVDFPSKWHTPRSFDYCEGLKILFPDNPLREKH